MYNVFEAAFALLLEDGSEPRSDLEFFWVHAVHEMCQAGMRAVEFDEGASARDRPLFPFLASFELRLFLQSYTTRITI